MALMQTLKDNFDSQGLSSAKWPSTFGTIAVDGVLTFRLPASTTGYHGFDSGVYDLTGSYAAIELVNAGNQALASLEVYPLQIFKDSNNTMSVLVSGNVILLRKKVAGVTSTVGSATYSAKAHRWVRVRESGGTTFCDTSPDGITWNNLTSLANPWAVTAVQMEIAAGTWGSEASGSLAVLDNFNVLPTGLTIPKSYSYRMFRNGNYLGELQDVRSEFTYSWDINTGFVQLSVEVGDNPDTANQLVQPLLDEATGATLTDEASGATLYEERTPDLFGPENDTALIQTGNDIKVYEISSFHPNGILVFDGYVESASGKFGTDSKFTMECLSNGEDLKDYILQTGGTTLQIDQSTTNFFVDTITRLDPFNYLYAQSFQPASAFSLGQVQIKVAWAPSGGFTAHGLTLKIYLGAPTTVGAGTPLATVSIDDTDTSQHWAIFNLATPLDVISGQTYHFSLECSNNGSEYDIGSVVPSGYASGNLFEGSPGDPYTSDTNEDMTFKVYSTDGATTSSFASSDPTTILRAAIDNYVAQGGSIDYDQGTTQLTGVTVTSYQFKLATLLEVVKKCLEWAPSDFYWRVDPATGILSFLETSTTADHQFVLGRHIHEIEVASTIENVRNVVYFSGGDTGGGANLFTYYTNDDSITENGRRRLERLSDNRTTTVADADLQVSSFLDERASEEYQTPLVIFASAYDISTIKPGQTAGFGGFGTFVDRLVLQIARVVVFPDRAELTVGRLPKSQNDRLFKAQGDLNKLQTIDNPSSPS